MKADTQLKTIQKNMKATLDFVNSDGKDEDGLNALMNCKVLRRESLMLLGNICYDFGLNGAKMSMILGLGVGPLIFLMAFCICCSAEKTMEQVREDEEEEEAKLQNGEYAKYV